MSRPNSFAHPGAIQRAPALAPPPETPKRHSLAVSVSEISEVVNGSGRFLGEEGRERLIEAAGNGDESVVRKLIDSGTNIDAAEISGRTALQAAAEAGHEGVVRMLLDAGARADVLPPGPSGRTALQVAAGNGHRGMVRVLIEAGANVNAPPSKSGGRTALQAAAGNGHGSVVRALLESGANVNALPSGISGRTALQAAAEGGYESVVQMLLNHGADIEAPPSEIDGRTALQAAAGGGNEKVVKILLDAGANIDAAPSEVSGRTALQAAAGDGRERVVSMLLRHRAKIDALPSLSDGRTALQAAAEAGHEDVVRMLIKAGAKADAPTAELHGKTALQAAAGGGHERVVKLLLDAEAGTGASQSESYGAEALEAAVGAGHEKVVKILLDGGVNINTKNSLGRTCLFSSKMSREMLKELLKLGAYIDTQDYDGLTPLHYAAEIGCKELLICLLGAGADMEIEDNRTRRPLHVAIEKKHEDLVKLLLERGDNIRDSRVRSWRVVLDASEEDIIMISENATRGNTIQTADIDKVQIGVEAEDILPMKQFYSAFGRKWNDNKCMQLVNPWEFMKKYIIISPEDHPDPSQADVQWMWALVNPKKDQLVRSHNFGSGIPNIGHIATTAHTKALLICYVCFDFFVHIPTVGTDSTRGESCFQTEIQKSQISWIMRKTESADRKSNPIFRSMNYRSTLEYGWVPNHGVDFFALFIQDLHNKWQEVFKKAEIHLKESRKNLLIQGGQTTSLIQTFLKDAQQWSDFRSLSKLHVRQARALVKEFQEKRLLYDEVKDWAEREQTGSGEGLEIGESSGEITDARRRKKKKQKKQKKAETDSGDEYIGTDESMGNTTDARKRKAKKAEKEQLGDREELETDDESLGEIINKKGKKTKKQKKKQKKKERMEKDEVETEIDKLNELIDTMKKFCKDEITKLEKKTREMIHLEFNLVSIFEARISTSTAISMKRLTWITFIFLPLLFVASLFGMNLDILDNNRVKWWWYVILSAAVFVAVLTGWAMFKHANVVGSWCGGAYNVVAEKAPPLPFIRRDKKILDDEENGKVKNC